VEENYGSKYILSVFVFIECCGWTKESVRQTGNICFQCIFSSNLCFNSVYI